MEILILIALSLIQIGLMIFVYQRVKIIEITRDITVISKPKTDTFIPTVIKPKTGIGNHIINELKNAN